MGNHGDGWNVVFLDASVKFLRAGEPSHDVEQTVDTWLSNDVKHKGAFLAVLKQPAPD